MTGETTFRKPPKQPTEDKEKALKIGVIGPETGEEGKYGLMTVEGARIAAEAFNSGGGLGGRPIELVNIDNKGDVGVTRAGLEKLVTENVIAIIGSPMGWSTLVPVYVANETRTIFVSAGTRRNIGSSGAFVFRMSLPIKKAAEEVIEYSAGTEGHKDYFMVTVMEDDALNVNSVFRRAADKHGINIKGDGSIFNEESIPEVVESLKANMPVDAVIFAGTPEMAVKFLKSAKKSGIKVPLIGGEELYSDEFLKAGELAKGSIIYTSFATDDENPATREFVKAYKKKNGKPPTAFAADAYDAFMLVANAIKEAGAPKPEAVRQGMMSTKGFKGVTGSIDVDSEREAIREPYILKATGSGTVRFEIVKSPHKEG